jgi:hypothetical protein
MRGLNIRSQSETMLASEGQHGRYKFDNSLGTYNDAHSINKRFHKRFKRFPGSVQLRV